MNTTALIFMADPIDYLVGLLALFSRSGLVPTTPATTREQPVNTPPAAGVQQSPPAPVPYVV